jgi:hypothetical protein
MNIDIVNLIENNPLTRLTKEYQSKLIETLKSNFTTYEQQMFVASFYCSLNYNCTTDFLIDLDNIWRWLGFSNKAHSKRILDNSFTVDKDFLVLSETNSASKAMTCNLTSQKEMTNIDEENVGVKKCDGRGGHNKEIIMLNVETFKRLCLKAGTKKADEIHDYYIKLEKVLQEILQQESDELRLQLQKQQLHIQELQTEAKQLALENEKIKDSENVPSMYIYNLDCRKEVPELKIGYSLCVNKRIKPYKQTCKFGKLEFSVPFHNVNIRTVENYIHLVLQPFKITDEVFQLNLEEAKIIILSVINLLSITSESSAPARHLKLKKMYEAETIIASNQPNPKISTCDASTQTDFDMATEQPKALVDTATEELNNTFKEFVDRFCIVRSDVEINCKDIIGQYRLWTKNTEKRITMAFKDYLDVNFKYTRLQKQDKNQVVNGYKGIALREIKYTKSLVKTDVETFIFERCRFIPGSTVLKSTLVDSYVKWKPMVDIPVTNDEATEITLYLKKCEHVMFATVWASAGSGQGYYGLKSKEEENDYKATSSTGKRVEKREVETNHLITSYDTIAKAAEAEHVSAAKMSRLKKNKVAVDGDYYYC